MYATGYNRLFYTSKTANGKLVEIDILNPELERSGKLEMIPVDEIFYVDVYFKQQGSYYIRVFEDSVEKHKQILVVNDGRLIVYPNENLI